jgi:hypothetical protein
MKGALPPSSSDSFLSPPAHWPINFLPTAVEPVNVSLRTFGFEVISPPMAPESPVMTLNAPGGTPARCASSARASAE